MSNGKAREIWGEPVRTSASARFDRLGLKEEDLHRLLYYLKLCRYFDERMEMLYRQGRLPGAIYSGRGQEGTHVGTGFALQREDVFLGTHRDLSVQLTKGLELKRVMAQFWGRVDGYTRGRDGNSHVGSFAAAGTFAVVSMLPDSYPVACGWALAFKRRGEERVAVAMCGEGATSNGRWHESLNLSSIHRLPAVWIVNNNQWAYSTPNRLEFSVPSVAVRAEAYGMPGIRVDGTDVLEVYEVVGDAVERARSGEGPSLIESVSLRWKGHAGHDPARYVPREMLDDYMGNRDPVKRLQDLLMSEGAMSEADAGALDERVKKEFDEAHDFAQRSPLPSGEDVTRGLWTEDGYWDSDPRGDGRTE